MVAGVPQGRHQERTRPQPPKKQKTTKQTWSAGQLRTFLTHVREDRLFAAWQLAALTGMRRGEVLGLSWADIDFDGNRLSVRRSLISSDYEVKVSEPKTEKGRRCSNAQRWRGLGE